jgi:NitT/TauT family transport system substrate-binding protein
MQTTQSRRRFLATLSSAGAASLLGAPDTSAQQAPPETTTVRLAKVAGICVAPRISPTNC